MRGWLGLIVLAVVLPLVPGHASARTRSRCDGRTATGVVRAYYAALTQHRPAAARACLTPQFLARARQFADPDWKNVISARIVSLRSRRVSDRLLPPDVTPPPYRAVQVGAQVTMQYRREYGSPDGLNVWFIYVIKRHPTSPWRIADIGSGP